MAEFKVHGPFRLETRKLHGGGRNIVRDDFWSSDGALEILRGSIGVYVFAIKPPRTETYTPCYVGQAKISFEKEALHDDKILKYNTALGDYKSGSPHLFFLAHPRTKINQKQITELEDYLIIMGFVANPEIQNDKGAKLPKWAISGIVRSKTRKPTKSEKHVASRFVIKSKNGV